MRCSRCGRVLYREAPCPGCGAPPGDVAPDPVVACPGCRTEMVKEVDEGLTIDRCPSCRGEWYDRRELEELLKAKKPLPPPGGSGRPTRFQLQGVTQPEARRACPRCGQPLLKKNYERVSGILVDVCGYHGVYLDDGELEKILAFVSTGGKQAAKAVVDDEEHRRRLAKEQVDQTSARMGVAGRSEESALSRTIVAGILELFR